MPIPATNGPRSRRSYPFEAPVVVGGKRYPKLTEIETAGALRHWRPVRLRTALTVGGLVLALAAVSAGTVGSAKPPWDRAAPWAPPAPGQSVPTPGAATTPTPPVPTPSSTQPASSIQPSPLTGAPTSAQVQSSKRTPTSPQAPASTSPPQPVIVAPPTPTTVPGPTFPIRAAFYYPWFPEGWNQQGMNPFTKYHPTLGLYSTSSASVVDQQIQAMQYGNIEVGIASWWGPGSKTDGRIPLLLQEAARTGFKWTLYYEAEGNAVTGEAGSPNPTVSQIQSDLTYISSRYGSDPNYLHVDGKPVIFVYGDPTDNCTTADRWAQANNKGFYVDLKVFPGYRTCPSQPDGWHQYDPSVIDDSQRGYSFSISPGFNKANEATPRLVRDPSVFATDAQLMVASGAPWQLVTTFNEWGEGTAVESAQEWASPSGEGTYLDILHANP